MTLQQLEYIVALEKTRQFVKAAEMCHVTQPTLSAMVQKLEDELGCRIFDRSAFPVVPTPVGEAILRQAHVILFNVRQLNEQVAAMKGTLEGALTLALIPTVAPYLIPGLLSRFRSDHPETSLKISEMRTATIVEKLRQAELDMAILSTPLEDPKILEIPLYYEKFLAYISPGEPIWQQREIAVNEISHENLWVLEEGHCLRNQVLNICESRSGITPVFEAGSIETLVKIVDTNGGFTIIPEMHTNFLDEKRQKNLRPMVRPEAVREISLVIRNDYIREGMVNAVAACIRQIIPDQMLDGRLKKFAIRL